MDYSIYETDRQQRYYSCTRRRAAASRILEFVQHHLLTSLLRRGFWVKVRLSRAIDRTASVSVDASKMKIIIKRSVQKMNEKKKTLSGRVERTVDEDASAPGRGYI